MTTQPRYFLRVATELAPAEVASILPAGTLAVSIDRGPLHTCRPCVGLTEEAAAEMREERA